MRILKLHHQAPATSALLSCWAAPKFKATVALLIHYTLFNRRGN